MLHTSTKQAREGQQTGGGGGGGGGLLHSQYDIFIPIFVGSLCEGRF